MLRTRLSPCVCLATAVAVVAVSLGSPSLLSAQAVKGTPAPGAAPPPVAYEGFVPGVTTIDVVRAKLGAPSHEGKWYAWKLLWPAAGRLGRFDSFHLLGGPEDGKIGTIEAVSVPRGFESLRKITGALGEPEFRLTLPGGQGLLDYSSRGVRFTLDVRGRTIGVAYFPHGYARVHSGCRRRLDLSALRQGPQPRPASPPDPNLLAGAFEVGINPRRGWLQGEFRIVDPLKARCAVFARGELRIAIVGADVFGMMKSEVDPIEARLREMGISHLFFAMSHDHAAPDAVGIYGFYPEKYVAHIQDEVVRGVAEAAKRLQPVKELLVASDELSLMGARVHGLFRNARNPGIVDPQIAVVQARGADGNPLVTIAQFACHVEGLEAGDKEISADFPGYMCDRLRASTGAPALFLSGAIGGMVSGDTKERTHEEAKIAGLRLAAEVERILAFAVPSSTRRLSFRRKRIEVPVTNPRFLLFEKMSSTRRKYYRGRAVSEIFHVRLGDAEIVSMPGELLPELAFEILPHMGGYPRMIVGLVNDELGYMIPAYDFRAGAYEESMSGGPAIGPIVTETAVRLIQEAR